MKKIMVVLVAFVLAMTTPALADFGVGIKTGGQLVTGDFSNKVIPVEVDVSYDPDVDWLGLSIVGGTYAGKIEATSSTLNARTSYAMIVPKLKYETNLGDLFAMIPGLSKEDDVPEPEDVIEPIPPVFDPATDFDRSKRVAAYTGVGIGGMWEHFSTDPSTDTENEFAFCYAPSVGASWAFNAALKMTFDYRYLIKVDNTPDGPNSHLFLAGLAYTF